MPRLQCATGLTQRIGAAAPGKIPAAKADACRALRKRADEECTAQAEIWTTRRNPCVALRKDAEAWSPKGLRALLLATRRLNEDVREAAHILRESDNAPIKHLTFEEVQNASREARLANECINAKSTPLEVSHGNGRCFTRRSKHRLYLLGHLAVGEMTRLTEKLISA